MTEVITIVAGVAVIVVAVIVVAAYLHLRKI